MSPKQPSIVSDPQSETMVPRRGRPPFPRELVLGAAETLFSEARAPKVVSMDDIAAAAGVGKGTLFRAFGNRDGLLDALFAARLDPLRAEIGRRGSSLGPDAPPAARVIAILDELLTFKLENPNLIKARELTGSTLLQAPHYRWVHNLLRELIVETGSTLHAADYAAHVLLGGLRVELITELLASGRSHDDLRRSVIAIAHQILGEPTTREATESEMSQARPNYQNSVAALGAHSSGTGADSGAELATST